MKLKLTYIIIATAVIFYQAHGQELKNNLAINIGAGQIARQDLVFSPFIHNDFTPLNIGLEYTRKASLYQNIRIRFASFNPMLTSPYEYKADGEIKVASQHYFSFIDLDYSAGKIINQSKKFSTTVGPLLTADVQMLNYAYGRIGSFGYYSAFGLGGFISNEFKLNERSLVVARFAIPLMNWLSRSPYLVNDDEFIENISSHSGLKTFFAFVGDGQLTSLKTLQSYDLEAKYTYQFHKRWELGAGYLFEYISIKEPRNLRSFRNSIFLNITYKF
jgi:hypothetical protein